MICRKAPWSRRPDSAQGGRTGWRSRFEFRSRNLLPGLLAVLRQRPVGPDMDVLLEQVADVRAPREHPEHLLDCRLPVDFPRREDREPLRHVVAHMAPEQGKGAHAGSVHALVAVVEDLLEDVEILALGVPWLCRLVHGFTLVFGCSRRSPQRRSFTHLPGCYPRCAERLDVRIELSLADIAALDCPRWASLVQHTRWPRILGSSDIFRTKRYGRGRTTKCCRNCFCITKLASILGARSG